MGHYMIWIDPINYFILLLHSSALINFHLKEKKRKLNSFKGKGKLYEACWNHLFAFASTLSSFRPSSPLQQLGIAQERKGDGELGEEEEAVMQVGSAYLSEPDQDGLFFYRSVIFVTKVYIILVLSVLRIRFFFLITVPWPVLSFLCKHLLGFTE